MAWIISIASLFVGIKTGNASLTIAAGLFAIAGSISFAASAIKMALETTKSKESTNTVTE